MDDSSGVSSFQILKEADSLFKLSRVDIEPGIFPAVFVSRDDIKRALNVDSESYESDFEGTENIAKEKIRRKLIEEKISNLTDREMIDISCDLQNAYVDGRYWDDLADICEDLNE